MDTIARQLFDIDYQFKSVDSYRVTLRAAIRGLWTGDLNYYEFFNLMQSAISRGFREAWAEGAAAYGVMPTEYTSKEQVRLQQEITKETNFINGLAEYVEKNNRASKGKLRTVQQRAEVWAKGYNRIVQIARTYAGGDRKQKWVLHPAEHCRSCLKLDGKVKRASYWMEHDVYPKHWDRLECRNGCKCTLDDTDDALSRGPLPSLP